MPLEKIAHETHFIALYFGHVIAFLLMYVSFGILSHVAIKNLFKPLSWGRSIDNTVILAKQYRTEFIYSAQSILIMSFTATLALWLEKKNLLTIQWNWAGAFEFGRDLLLFFIWNELYFYASHRILHTPWLYKKVHYIHHQSNPTNPFSTFSFHWFEALMYSGIMITAMCWWDFNVYAMIAWPILSLFLNNIGHTNYTLFPRHSINSGLNLSIHHALHHTFITGNFCFCVPQVDQFFKTQVKVLKREDQLANIKVYNKK